MQLVDRALGLDQTYYETECPDVSEISQTLVTTNLLIDHQPLDC